MTNQITDVRNFVETTLTAGVNATALSFPVDSLEGMTTPCFIVIDPDIIAKREVILCDGVFGSSSFVTSDLSNRGLEGSAAGAVSHDINAVVRVAPLSQHIDDLNDRITAHAHGGGTDGTQVDHGGLAGLNDDDHTQYTKADGTRAFTGQVSGITPTTDPALATKGYVDGYIESVDASPNHPFRVVSASYTLGTDTLTVNIGNGRVRWDDDITFALDAAAPYTTAFTQTPVTASATYYVYVGFNTGVPAISIAEGLSPADLTGQGIVVLGSVTLDGAKNVTDITDLRGLLPVPGHPQGPNVVLYAASGTFVKADYPLGRAIRVRGWAAGGGSGGAVATGAGEVAIGSAGSGGAHFEKVIDFSVLAASETFTIGAAGTAGAAGGAGGNGGDTSFGAHATAGGGAGGDAGGAQPPTTAFGQTQLGGTASGGDLNIAGGPSGSGFATANNRAHTGQGGAGAGGGSPGRTLVVSANTAGSPGVFPGGGASGGANAQSQVSAVAGSAGAAGFGIIEVLY